MTLVDTLRTTRFTAGLADRHSAKLASLARKVHFSEDELVLVAGQRSTHFYLVLSGSACVEVRTPVYTMCVQVLGPGDAFGWSSFLGHQDTLFQVRAREATCALCWDASELHAACRGNPEFGLELFERLLDLVAGRVKATETKLAEFYGAPSFAGPSALSRASSPSTKLVQPP